MYLPRVLNHCLFHLWVDVLLLMFSLCSYSNGSQSLFVLDSDMIGDDYPPICNNVWVELTISDTSFKQELSFEYDKSIVNYIWAMIISYCLVWRWNVFSIRRSYLVCGEVDQRIHYTNLRVSPKDSNHLIPPGLRDIHVIVSNENILCVCAFQRSIN